MRTATFTVNGQDFKVMLNNNEELTAQNSGLTDAQRTLIQSLPRAEGSTVSQYKVKVDNLVVDGNSRANGLLKLAASMIQDETMKAAVRASHHSGSGVTKPDSKDSQEFKDAQSEWAKVMQEIDYSKYPALTAFMGVEDPVKTAIGALMAVGFTKEAAEAAIKAQKEAAEAAIKAQK